jgi:hypothetical protein
MSSARATMGLMRAQRFGASVGVGPRGHVVIAIPFDPDQVWGAKAEHPVSGTINGRRVRTRITPGDGGWMCTLSPMWLSECGVAAGEQVSVELAPEGPQRADLADDIAAALAIAQRRGFHDHGTWSVIFTDN